MSGSYLIEAIDLKTIDRAYPLAKVVVPALLEYEWSQVCHSVMSSSRRLESLEKEEIVVARNAEGYVKGLCIYTIRTHATYGRVVDVPLFVSASAADGEGVTMALLDFLRAKCDGSICSGIRLWTMNQETWTQRLRSDHIARSDHGLFMPALASAAEIEKALLAHGFENAEAIDQLSR